MPGEKQEGLFERAGKVVDKKINAIRKGIDQALDTTKEHVNRQLNEKAQQRNAAKELARKGVNHINNCLNDTAKKAGQVLSSTFDALANGYNYVSQSVKQKYTAGKEKVSAGVKYAQEKTKEGTKRVNEKLTNLKEWTSQVINYTKERTIQKIEELDKARQQITDAMKAGTLKAIKRSENTGKMLITIGKNTYEYHINRLSTTTTKINKALKEGAIQSVNFIKGTGEVIIQTGKEKIKTTYENGIATGIFIVKGGKIFINQMKIKIGKSVEKAWKFLQESAFNEIREATNNGINKGNQWVNHYQQEIIKGNSDTQIANVEN